MSTLTIEASANALPVVEPAAVPGMGDALQHAVMAGRYAPAARSGDNRFAMMLRELRKARRIMIRYRQGKYGRRRPRYLAKGGIKR